jgi:hypothetical protein
VAQPPGVNAIVSMPTRWLQCHHDLESSLRAPCDAVFIFVNTWFAGPARKTFSISGCWAVPGVSEGLPFHIVMRRSGKYVSFAHCFGLGESGPNFLGPVCGKKCGDRHVHQSVRCPRIFVLRTGRGTWPADIGLNPPIPCALVRPCEGMGTKCRPAKRDPALRDCLGSLANKAHSNALHNFLHCGVLWQLHIRIMQTDLLTSICVCQWPRIEYRCPGWRSGLVTAITHVGR